MTAPTIHDVSPARGTVAISFNMPLQRMRDILTTAYESGIGYWVNVENEIKLCEAFRDTSSCVYAIRFTFIDGKVTTVDDIGLAIAFAKALAVGDDGDGVYPAPCAAAVGELNGEYDANTADSLVQFALFGEVRYG